ncbi:hypothetical protein MCOR07_011524 [Pyricularia oryzae]|uniref:Uncharacterized protein n=1 Tax=Pyricularia grisea TaxID=148305 RepID=A0ABQ8NLH6_PYRGI|nr:hypothetical protein MCOR01_006509 [Pyricularia oryzae]KAI6298939.1 hypothetical protein MCOR33_004998 [Pyricularia grisea]KAI6260917.1 hypothetical protein MCOR19_002786 [Pyricularia oryzae]KAI6280224.1 hypothetical protein MCOR26_003817 [Pyricularia oryzae]KAI6322648.1 hypothetical protein MCOR29_004673 [Pyricularia oryzae]
MQWPAFLSAPCIQRTPALGWSSGAKLQRCPDLAAEKAVRGTLAVTESPKAANRRLFSSRGGLVFNVFLDMLQCPDEDTSRSLAHALNLCAPFGFWLRLPIAQDLVEFLKIKAFCGFLPNVAIWTC